MYTIIAFYIGYYMATCNSQYNFSRIIKEENPIIGSFIWWQDICLGSISIELYDFNLNYSSFYT